MDIFVGSIPFSFKEKDLIDLFSEFGEVSSARIVINKMTRQNKGFGFVTMPKDAEAELAIKKLHGSIHQERMILVSKAKTSSDGHRQVQNERSGDWFKKSKKRESVITYGDPKPAKRPKK